MNMPEEIRNALKKSGLDKHAKAEFVLIEIGKPELTQKSASFELRWMINAA